MTEAIEEMKLAARMIEHEDFMGVCAGGMPLIAGKDCHFCGASKNGRDGCGRREHGQDRAK